MTSTRRINAVTISLVEIFCENQPGFRIQILFPVWSIAYRSHSRFACPILLKAMNAIKCGYETEIYRLMFYLCTKNNTISDFFATTAKT